MAALATILPELDGVPDVDVVGVTDDSREVAPGDLFLAVAGARSDGHDFAAAAAERGAAAVLAERAIAGLGVPVVVVPDLKRLRSAIAGRVLGDPGGQLYCVGVTGTNGKTSVAFYLAELATRLGHATGYLGTIGWGCTTELEPALLTTDSAVNTQKRLKTLVERGFEWVAMEVSSHALDQHRVEAVGFDVGVFTNLSRDHLDYHDSFEAYGAAKARLFEDVNVAVVNTDDPFGQRLARGLRVPTLITYGRDGDVRWRALELDARGVRGRWETPWGNTEFELPLVGEFAVANVSAVVAVLCQAGLVLADVAALAARIAPVPGRLEFFPGAPSAVVDYAHTPAALETVLTALRPHVAGRLVCLVGCGGDRDRGKRPLMAAAAETGADEVWLTSDNPRGEDPAAILADMRSGLSGRVPVHEQADRARAIEAALTSAAPADLVLVAGKGHEDYQEVGGQRLPFSDRAIVRALVQRQSGGLPASDREEG